MSYARLEEESRRQRERQEYAEYAEHMSQGRGRAAGSQQSQQQSQRAKQRQYQQWQQQWQRQQQQQQQAPPGGGRYASRNELDPAGLYAELGVPPTATKEEIQAAFRGLALRFHPDRGGSDAEKQQLTARFQRLSAAYHVLRDEKRRRRYDATGETAV